MTIETWLPVVGLEGDYEVSDQGRVRSVDRVKVYKRIDQYSGREITVTRHHKGRLLKPARKPCGHMSIVLGRGVGSRDVHVLVLEAFVGPRPPIHEGPHWDDDPSNNKLSNLRWGTRSDNLLDAVRNGKMAVSENHRLAKLKNADVQTIRSLFGKETLTSMSHRFGVSISTLHQIKYGKSWKSLAGVAA